MTEKLKDCPFCGGEACGLNLQSADSKPNIYSVDCRYCSARVYGMKHTAIAGWNARASPWVKIEDGLPEKEDEYLVTMNGQTRRCRFYLDDDGEGGFASSNVTAWQPLPEPYAPDTEGR